MFRKCWPLFVVVFALFATGCNDTVMAPGETSRDAGLAPRAAVAPPHAVSVLNWNVYVGTDLDLAIAALISPDPADDIPVLLGAIEVLQNTAFHLRAEAIADVVARRLPDVIGLQEVWTVDIDLTALNIPVVIDMDFLAILQTALLARGLDYVVAAQVINTEAVPLPGILAADRDVILVNPARVNVLSATGQNFSNNIGIVAPGVEIKRGWVSVVGDVNGRVMTFVNTHLESGPGEQLSNLRAAQAIELMTILGTASPAILMGDLNEGEGSLMYQVVTGAGFVDLWRALRFAAAGLTCCHEPDLSNSLPGFDQRIDFVLARGLGYGGRVMGQISIVGKTPNARLAGPAYSIWPSDHAGLAVRILQPPGLMVP